MLVVSVRGIGVLWLQVLRSASCLASPWAVTQLVMLLLAWWFLVKYGINNALILMHITMVYRLLNAATVILVTAMTYWQLSMT